MFQRHRKKEEVEKILTAKDGNNKSYPVEIIPTDNLTRYQFCINQVPRDTEDYQLTITANGSPARIDQTQSEEVLIPAKDSFRFLSATRIDEPEMELRLCSPPLYPIHRT